MSKGQDNAPLPSNNLSLVLADNNQGSGIPNMSSENGQTSDNSISHNLIVQDLRQPQTLQDLLKMSTRLQSNNSGNAAGSEHLSKDRVEFLQNALNAMSVDLVGEMQKRIDTLKEIQTKPEHFVESNLNKYEDTLQQLVEYLYEIDLAQIFYQINGMNVITPLLQSKYSTLRSSSAAIIVECCKNNLFCQELSVSDEVFDPLMKMASSDPNKDAMFKAIAAVSAIIRSNPAGITQFNKYHGIQMVEEALNSGCEKIVNKTIFLIMALCDTDAALKQKLTEAGSIQTLITLLQLSDNIVKEYILRALLSITAENTLAQDICRQHDLNNYLSHLCEKNTDPECQDLLECATNLHKQLFSHSPLTPKHETTA